MTQKGSNARLTLYVSIVMLSTASAGLATVDFTHPKQVAGFVISVLVSGLVTARSYIDNSESQIDQP